MTPDKQYDGSQFETSTVATSDQGILHKFKAKAKGKTKRVLNVAFSNEDTSKETSQDAALHELEESPAFNSHKFLNKARMGPSGIQDKTTAFFKVTGNAVTHPIATIKSHASRKTAGKLAKSRPILSKKADLDFLQAQDDLQRTLHEQNISGGTESENEEQISRHLRQIEELERSRTNMRVAWVTGRHVKRVKAVASVAHVAFPPDEFFEGEDDCGFIKFNWGDWLACKLLFLSHPFTARYIDDFQSLPYEENILRLHVERLIVVSAPLQSFFTDIMHIYRWENPVRTGKWLIIYSFFWYISHVGTFVFGYIIYSTVMNYLYPCSLADLRAEITRSLDRGSTALKIGELMDRHGSHDWVTPLLNEVGPTLQVQINDFANLLEAFYNFYHYKYPPATYASLCLVGAYFIISLTSSSDFVLKLAWFQAGGMFFLLWPIGSIAPRYRLLVSFPKWALWDVPTNAEWCFEYLQERSIAAKDAILAANRSSGAVDSDAGVKTSDLDYGSDDSDDSFLSAKSVHLEDGKDVLSFGCTYTNVPGHLILSTNAIRFKPAIKLSNSKFHRPFHYLLELSKIQKSSSIMSPLARVTTGVDALEIRFREGDTGVTYGDIKDPPSCEIMLLENIRERDRAFNALIGFSGLKWQNLQPRASGEVDWKRRAKTK